MQPMWICILLQEQFEQTCDNTHLIGLFWAWAACCILCWCAVWLCQLWLYQSAVGLCQLYRVHCALSTVHCQLCAVCNHVQSANTERHILIGGQRNKDVPLDPFLPFLYLAIAFNAINTLLAHSMDLGEDIWTDQWTWTNGAAGKKSLLVKT